MHFYSNFFLYNLNFIYLLKNKCKFNGLLQDAKTTLNTVPTECYLTNYLLSYFQVNAEPLVGDDLSPSVTATCSQGFMRVYWILS